jgi:hypothetical protein
MHRLLMALLGVLKCAVPSTDLAGTTRSRTPRTPSSLNNIEEIHLFITLVTQGWHELAHPRPAAQLRSLPAVSPHKVPPSLPPHPC